MSLYLAFIADKSHVEEVFLLPEFFECNADIGFEVSPSQTKLFICHLHVSLFTFERDSETLSKTYSLVISENFLNTIVIPRYPDLHSTDYYATF